VATDVRPAIEDEEAAGADRRPRTVRLIAGAIVAVLVVVVALILLDRWLVNAGESRAEDRVSEELDAPVEVTFHGSPRGLQMLTGRVERVEVRSTDVHLEDSGATLDRLDVTLHGINLGWRDVLDPPNDLPPSDSGTFEARLSDDATWALAQVPRGLASLVIADGAIRLRTLLGEASADVLVVNGTLQVIPRTALGVLLSTPVTIDLSDQPGDPVIESAWIDDDTLVLAGSLQDVTGE
jgi:hypothetical protein